VSGKPQRTCIACRRVGDKEDLVRLVRTADGRVRVDREGRAMGRGAYACACEGCLAKALTAGRLGHALRRACEPPADSAAVILEYWRRR